MNIDNLLSVVVFGIPSVIEHYLSYRISNFALIYAKRIKRPVDIIQI